MCEMIRALLVEGKFDNEGVKYDVKNLNDPSFVE